VFPADFIIPYENIYRDKPPPNMWIELKALNLFAPVDSVTTTPLSTNGTTPSSSASQKQEILNYTASVAFTIALGDSPEEKECTFTLAKDINFLTAHPCVPSTHVRILKSPSSPTIQQVDLTGNGGAGKNASTVGKGPLRPHTPCT
jgi:hypothetical protein